MSVVVVTPIAEELIDLAIVKAYLRVEHEDHDDLIQMHLDAAIGWLDGPAGWLGRSLGPQVLRLDGADVCAADGLELPLGPVTEIVGITWTDGDGVEQTVADEIYELRANRVRLLTGQSWPAFGAAGPSVEYEAGYAVGEMPSGLQAAILMHVKIQYDPAADQTSLERARDALLSPLRLWRI